MAIRNRTTKSVAKRHDLDYFKRGSAVRLWQWRLALASLLAAVVWLGVSGVRHGDRMFSAGPMSSSHAAFGARCVACHEPLVSAAGWVQLAGSRRRATDAACLNCHVAPAHHAENVTFTPECGSCHVEHAGSMHLAAASDRTCTQCHAALQVRTGSMAVASRIRSFVDGHPEFRPLRQVGETTREAAFSLKFNHAAHLGTGLSGPVGRVTMQCADCHRTPSEASSVPWRFAGAAQSLAVANSSPRAHRSDGTEARSPEEVHTDAAYMESASYRQTCQACHTLEFDSHIAAAAPHADPATVQRFVVEQLTAYAASHPAVVTAEIRSGRPVDELAGQRLTPAPRTVQEWIAARVARADRILWQGKCSLCHTVTGGLAPAQVAPASAGRLVRASLEMIRGGGLSASDAGGAAPGSDAALPVVAPTTQPERWYAGAVFRHDAHQEVKCVSCHQAAMTSTSGKDLLMPSITVCQQCHDGASRPQGPPVETGKAESGCFLCHSYHGWTAAGESVLGHPHQALSVEELTVQR